MITLRRWILAAFVGLALPVSGLADDDPLMAKMDALCKSTIARVGPKLTISFGGQSPLQCELVHNGVQTGPGRKLLGPSADGFVFRVRRFSKNTLFQPDLGPFSLEDRSKQAMYPWVSEAHFFPAGGDSWLWVSIWRGEGADQQLIHELLEATAKIVEEQRRGRQR